MKTLFILVIMTLLWITLMVFILGRYNTEKIKAMAKFFEVVLKLFK